MKPKELRNVCFRDIFSGKVELPEGVTRERVLGTLLQIDLHQIFTHSRVERDGNVLRYVLYGTTRAVAHLNSAGEPEGELRVLWPDGHLWILANYRAGRPSGRWFEYLPDGTPLPGQPFGWLGAAAP